MSKDIRKFRTYGQQSRRDYERHNRNRKAEVRAVRLEAIYSKTATPVTATY